MALDVLFTNGDIRTQDPDRPAATAIGVHAGRIVSLDDDLPAEVFGRVVDLGGRVVVPGFHDAHIHVSYLGEALMQVDVSPDAAPPRVDLLAAVRERAAETPDGQWVIGTGYNQNYFDDGEHPTAEQLDEAAPDNPVWLWHNSRHMGVANTRAFEEAGFPGRTGFEVPEGGDVPVDGEGRARGLMLETAKGLIVGAIPAKTAENVAEQLRLASEALLAKGVTSAVEPGLGAPGHIGQCPVDLAAFQLAHDRGDLGVRMTVMPYITTLHPLGREASAGADELEEGQAFGLDHGMRTGFGDDRLRIGPVKVLSDGSLIGLSAYMREDYASGEEGNRGLLQFPEEFLRDNLIAPRNGWQLSAHAIGDAALDVILDIYEEAMETYPREECRHRVEHLGMASDEQIARCARLGVIPVSQGRFVNELGDGMARALGPERAKLCYRMKSLLDAGIDAPASTDAPPPKENRMTRSAGHLIAASLEAHGVERVFSVPGRVLPGPARRPARLAHRQRRVPPGGRRGVHGGGDGEGDGPAGRRPGHPRPGRVERVRRRSHGVAGCDAAGAVRRPHPRRRPGPGVLPGVRPARVVRHPGEGGAGARRRRPGVGVRRPRVPRRRLRPPRPRRRRPAGGRHRARHGRAGDAAAAGGRRGDRPGRPRRSAGRAGGRRAPGAALRRPALDAGGRRGAHRLRRGAPHPGAVGLARRRPHPLRLPRQRRRAGLRPRALRRAGAGRRRRPRRRRRHPLRRADGRLHAADAPRRRELDRQPRPGAAPARRRRHPPPARGPGGAGPRPRRRGAHPRPRLVRVDRRRRHRPRPRHRHPPRPRARTSRAPRT